MFPKYSCVFIIITIFCLILSHITMSLHKYEKDKNGELKKCENRWLIVAPRAFDLVQLFLNSKWYVR